MRNLFVTFIAFVLLFSSCKRTNKESILGPEIKAASPNFQMLDTLKANYFNGYKPAKSDSISFQYVQEIPKLPKYTDGHADTLKDSDGKVVKNENGDVVFDSTNAKINYNIRKTFFKAKFNEEVSWKLTLTKFNGGDLDYSVKHVILGTSSYLDSSNTSWDGKANGTLFAKGDLVLAELTFVNGSSLLLKDTLFIAKGELYNQSEATLLTDFEDGLVNAYPYNDKTDPVVSPLPHIDNTIRTPQGSNSLLIYGNDHNGDYFGGGISIQSLDVKTMSNYSPKDIYINLYIYGYPTPNALDIVAKATKLNISINEDDANFNAVFDEKIEDTFEKQIAVDWVGWKLISVRYSDLVRSAVKAVGGSGNGKFEPSKAFSANCNLISSPNGSIVGTNIDYVIITYGQPFDASNL